MDEEDIADRLIENAEHVIRHWEAQKEVKPWDGVHPACLLPVLMQICVLGFPCTPPHTCSRSTHAPVQCMPTLVRMNAGFTGLVRVCDDEPFREAGIVRHCVPEASQSPPPQPKPKAPPTPPPSSHDGKGDSGSHPGPRSNTPGMGWPVSMV